jgi:signal peptidase I
MRFALGFAMGIFLSLSLLYLSISYHPFVAESNNYYTTTLADISSPGDRINQSSMSVYNILGKLIIASDLNTSGRILYYASVTNTKSMDPAIDRNSTVILYSVLNESELKVGDVISYYYSEDYSQITHRIIEINSDDNGWYCVTKGDNVAEDDGVKIRFGRINSVLLGVLY